MMMSRKMLVAVMLASAAFLAAPAAYAQSKSYTSGHFQLEVGGSVPGYIKATPKPAAPAKTLQSPPLKAPTLEKK